MVQRGKVFRKHQRSCEKHQHESTEEATENHEHECGDPSLPVAEEAGRIGRCLRSTTEYPGM